MSGAALERVFRDASARIIAALAARFRDLALAEDACAEACARALGEWPSAGVPDDPAAWLYRVAYRVALDAIRHSKTHQRLAPVIADEQEAQPLDPDDTSVIPDERLRLIFICCHPAVSIDARAALTLRLVCGLTTEEIARAFLLSETTLAQRLTRAKQKIADAHVPFELPRREQWPERLDAVLSTIEVAYAKAHEDAAAIGPHAHYAAEMLHLSRLLAHLMPQESEALALASIIHFTEARRPARVDVNGVMVPLSEQNPANWDRGLIDKGAAYLSRAKDAAAPTRRLFQAAVHACWCRRRSVEEAAPWPDILTLYDRLLAIDDNPIVRLNRAVALAEIDGPAAALAEVSRLHAEQFAQYGSYHAARADLLSRTGDWAAAREAYDSAINLVTTRAERAWLMAQRDRLSLKAH